MIISLQSCHLVWFKHDHDSLIVLSGSYKIMTLQSCLVRFITWSWIFSHVIWYSNPTVVAYIIISANLFDVPTNDVYLFLTLLIGVLVTFAVLNTSEILFICPYSQNSSDNSASSSLHHSLSIIHIIKTRYYLWKKKVLSFTHFLQVSLVSLTNSCQKLLL